MKLTVACADIGSISRGRFGWALRDCPGDFLKCDEDGDIGVLVSEVSKRLRSGQGVALGFECPLFVPLPEDPVELTRARQGEGNRAWCAGAGSGALATGLTEVTWILKKLRYELAGIENPTVSVDWSVFTALGGLFLWEALVSRDAKTDTHCGDARVAVDAFIDALPDPQTSIDEESVFSLVGAALLRAGWEVPLSMLEEPILVITAEPRHSSRTRSARR